MTEDAKREVVWRRNQKAPVLKLESINFDLLEVRVRGDAEGIILLDRKALELYARKHERPRHFTLKIVPGYLRSYWSSGFRIHE